MRADVGLWTGSIESQPLAAIPEIATTIESQGWSSLWIPEAVGREAFTASQLLLAATSRLAIGTGIASIWGRDAFAAASAGRTLRALSDNRFTLGLGVSHAPLVERMRGHNYGRPVAAMRDYLRAIQQAPPTVPGEADLPPIVIAALGPKMLDAAVEFGVGVHPYLVTPDWTAATRSRVGSDTRVVVEQAAVIDPAADRDEWRRRAQWHLEIYTGLPNYRASFERQGFSAEDDAVRGGSEKLKEALVTHGVDATAARIDEHFAAGATEVVLQVLGTDITQVPTADWQLLAETL
ncbi:TIGR03620 family F420-dependent LLM class oxidoreductase [Jongsikchunia kroppenstedtii]|uniref:TIGR03620 family F420-dependent LLM class oxidoreductase n=1 Tax=Jongsikchunia kroppenstedtii TaxID=1121721 RepID=UPI0003A859B8|nr:TIGR03620 family F420-dependent LLM class oxidoreductase [Jongsikchunia kroppenstedtii]